MPQGEETPKGRKHSRGKETSRGEGNPQERRPAGGRVGEETPRGRKHPSGGKKCPGGERKPLAPGDPVPHLQQVGGRARLSPPPRCPAAPPYLADEVDAEEDLPGGLQGAAAGLLPVQLARPAGQDEEAADDGDGPRVHPYLCRDHRHPPGPSPRPGWAGQGARSGGISPSASHRSGPGRRRGRRRWPRPAGGRPPGRTSGASPRRT